MKNYPMGFIFSDSPIENIPDHYILSTVLNQYYYYYDNDCAQNVKTKSNKFIIIHGYYKYINVVNDIDNTNLLNHLLNYYFEDYEKFLNTIDFISGRYVIIVGNSEQVEFYQDATGARSVYYSLDLNLVSTHAHLLNQAIPHQLSQIALQIPSLTISWDFTPYNRIRSMTPNSNLNLFSKKKKRFFPRESNKYTEYTDQEKVDLIEILMKKQLEYYINTNQNVITSLTGGLDSRVSMSLLKEYSSKINFFTYYALENNEEMSDRSVEILDLDKKIVDKLLPYLDINHKYFIYNEMNTNYTQEIDEILKKNTVIQHLKYLVAEYINYFPNKDILHIKSNLNEIARAYFINNTKKNEIDEIISIFKHSVRSHAKGNEEKIDNLSKVGVLNLNFEEPLHDFHILDLFYWENRMGRWHAESLNETDVVFETFLPFNMRSIIEASLSFTLSQRKNDYLFKELINKNYPILNFFGINSLENLYEQYPKKLINNSDLSSFKVFDALNSKTYSISQSGNKIYIPVNSLSKDSYSERKYVFNQKRGVVMLTIKSNYFSSRSKGYLEYKIIVNGKEYLNEDISYWNLDNRINIFNLKSSDEIIVRVIALRNAKASSWERASTVYIDDYQEIQKGSDSPIHIKCTSPYSVIKI